MNDAAMRRFVASLQGPGPTYTGARGPVRLPGVSNAPQATIGPIQRSAVMQALDKYLPSVHDGVLAARRAVRPREGDPFAKMVGLLGLTDGGLGIVDGPAAAAMPVARTVARKIVRDLPLDEASRMARAREQGFDVDEPLYRGLSRPFNPRKGVAAEHEVKAHFFTDDPALASDYAMDRAGGGFALTQGEIKAAIAAELDEAESLPEIAGRPAKRFVESVVHRNESDDDFAITLELLHSKGRGDLAAVAGRARTKAMVLEAERLMNGGGQNVIPAFVRGPLLDAPHTGEFNEHVYNAALRRAREGGYAGVRFRDIVDTPSGFGAPSTVVGVFDPKNIRSRFARFDPAKINSANLSAGLGGLLATGAAVRQKREKR